MTEKCDVCGGGGRYPIHDMHGRERYTISCPECYGSGLGEEPEEAAAEPEDWAPKSTAAAISSSDEMREYVSKHWSPR